MADGDSEKFKRLTAGQPAVNFKKWSEMDPHRHDDGMGEDEAPVDNATKKTVIIDEESAEAAMKMGDFSRRFRQVLLVLTLGAATGVGYLALRDKRLPDKMSLRCDVGTIRSSDPSGRPRLTFSGCVDKQWDLKIPDPPFRLGKNSDARSIRPPKSDSTVIEARLGKPGEEPTHTCVTEFIPTLVNETKGKVTGVWVNCESFESAARRLFDTNTASAADLGNQPASSIDQTTSK